MRFMKPTAAALALVVGAFSLSAPAEAYYRHHNHGGDALAAGIFGFTAGALLTGALAPRYYPDYDYYYAPEPIYVAPPPPVVYQPAPVYYAAPQPWTPDWYSYCGSRYQSFNGRTGYFYGLDGQYHFCR